MESNIKENEKNSHLAIHNELPTQFSFMTPGQILMRLYVNMGFDNFLFNRLAALSGRLNKKSIYTVIQ